MAAAIGASSMRSAEHSVERAPYAVSHVLSPRP
ncbi:hypothetical protein SSPS47_26965 [Streptomyces sp. S4.7]|nr:hypothetical protein SSPS47_26965 [Streptomyces sp. S4.7]